LLNRKQRRIKKQPKFLLVLETDPSGNHFLLRGFLDKGVFVIQSKAQLTSEQKEIIESDSIKIRELSEPVSLLH
jgi:hypothetical protein